MISALLLSASLLGSAYGTTKTTGSTLIDLNSTTSTGPSVLQSTKFDYIIVGGGTAGLTVAKRLAENSASTKILVLEAGGSGVGQDVVTIPFNSFHFVGTDIDWGYEIAPQQHAAGQEINLSMGKILGGDSAVNGLVWSRGNKAEYDAFETLGNEGWNWDELYPYMKKAENLDYPSAAYIEEYGVAVTASSLGSGGPVTVSYPAYIPLQHQKFIDAAVELGQTFNKDAYGGNNTGAYYSLSSQNLVPVRQDAEFAYLDSITVKTKLTTIMHAMVSKINFKSTKSGVKATGVQLSSPNGTTYTATLASGGEVILAAGVIRTPQLLELSGIGNPDILTPLGIDVLVDLPGVGENYEDQTLTLLTYALQPGFLSFDALSYNATLLAEEQALYKKGQGWYTFAQAALNFEPIGQILNSSELAEAKTLFETKPDSIPQDQFDIIKEQVFNGVPQVEYLLFNSFSAGTDKLPNTSYVSMAITHLHPLSRGSIHINTTSVNDHPIIDPNMLESEWDAWFLAKASAFARKIFQTKTMQSIVVSEETYPGASVQTTDEWIQFAKEGLNAAYHSIGTASMMPRASNGVVDANLQVYGTTNLRVVDLSAMPMHISAHTQPAAYTFGERAAAIIIAAQN